MCHNAPIALYHRVVALDRCGEEEGAESTDLPIYQYSNSPAVMSFG